MKYDFFNETVFIAILLFTIMGTDVLAIQDGQSPSTAGLSALQILNDGYSTGDGIYWLDPDGIGGNPPFQAYADMTRDGGGWTLALKTWYQAGHYRNISFVGVIADALTLKGNPYKLSDESIRNIIGSNNNFDVLAEQTGFNSAYSTGNFEYVILKNYTGIWDWSIPMPDSTTTTVLQSYRKSDNVLAWTGEMQFGIVGGAGINGFNITSGPVPEGGNGCNISMGTNSSTSWHHFYMAEYNSDSYLYICNGAQHSSGHNMNHLYWFRSREYQTSLIPYNVGVTVTGLVGGTLVLQNNGDDDLSISSNNSYIFSNQVKDGNGYAVSVFDSPVTPRQSCIVTGGDNGDGTGSILGGDDLSVMVNCNAEPIIVNDVYTINEDTSLVADDANGVIGGSNDNGIFANDSDIEGDTITVINPGVYNGSIGDLEVATNGTFTYMPAMDKNGVDIFDFSVTDGVSIVNTMVSITVLPINDQPSFVVNNTDVSNKVINNTAQVIGFIDAVVFGPVDEQNSQNVQQYSLIVVSDTNNIISSDMVEVSTDGTLMADLTFNSGTATIDISLQDTGGTVSGGIDTSVVQQFSLTYNNSVFSDGFEEFFQKLMNLIVNKQTELNIYDGLRFDTEKGVVQFNDYEFWIHQEIINDELIDKVIEWIEEVELTNSLEP